MYKKFVLLVGIFVLVLSGLSGIHADEMSAEELLFMSVPEVVSAGKRIQRMTDAPATIDVITSDDIKITGVTTIPDALRLVAGVEVMTLVNATQEVSIRGFNGAYSNHVLIMVDGIPFNWAPYGNAAWDAVPVGMDEIDRIEIVKSPISSLYGAQAYCGTINIITKSPDKINGTILGVKGGSYSKLAGTAIHGAEIGNFNYKVSTEWDTTSEYGNPDEIDVKIFRLNTALKYMFDEDKYVAVMGSRTDNYNIQMTGLGAFNTTGDKLYNMLSLEGGFSGVKFKGFFREYNSNLYSISDSSLNYFVDKTWDWELSHSGVLFDSHNFIYGVTARQTEAEAEIFRPRRQIQKMYSAFAEDAWSILDNLVLTGGVRYDNHPLTGNNLSPRGHLLFKPSEEHIIKLSAAQAFRNPTVVDNYMYVSIPISPVTNFYALGSDDAKPENIISFEGEYRFLQPGKVNASVNGFYNMYKDFIRRTRSVEMTYFPPNSLYPGFPGAYLPTSIIESFKNSGTADGIGAEVSIDVQAADWLNLFANYAYLQITDRDDDTFTTTVNEKNKVREDNPKNKVNFGAKLKFDNGLSGSITSSWVDKIRVFNSELGSGEENIYDVDPHLIWNMTIRYSIFNEDTSLWVSAFNVFDSKHYEYTPGGNPDDLRSTVIGRKITGGATFKF